MIRKWGNSRKFFGAWERAPAGMCKQDKYVQEHECTHTCTFEHKSKYLCRFTGGRFSAEAIHNLALSYPVVQIYFSPKNLTS